MADNQVPPNTTGAANVQAEPSNTTGPSQSSNTKDQEIATLQAKLDALQQAANQQVPASVIGEANKNTGMDPELAALDLDWGDFDPAFMTMLNQNKAIRDSFIAAQTLAADSTQCMDDGKMIPKAAYNKKRARGDQDQLVTTLNLAENPDEAIMTYFTKYHNSTILPQLEMFRSGASQLWETQTQRFSMQTRQIVSLQQQVAMLERDRSRRTILLKNLPSPLPINELKNNLSTLLYKAGVNETAIQDKFNHYGMDLGTVVFVTFNSEAAAGAVKSILKHGFWWHSDSGDFRIKWEEHKSASGRILMQPFYAATDILIKHFEGSEFKIRNDKRYMQIFKLDDQENTSLLAQLFFNPSEDGYRAFLMVHENHW